VVLCPMRSGAVRWTYAIFDGGVHGMFDGCFLYCFRRGTCQKEARVRVLQTAQVHSEELVAGRAVREVNENTSRMTV
jgi:hypothetical protein